MYAHTYGCIFGSAILNLDTEVNFRSSNRVEQKKALEVLLCS